MSDRLHEIRDDDGFETLVEKFGEPHNARMVNPLEAWSYKGAVPDALIRFWVEHGQGSYLDGLFSIVDPKHYKPIVEALFEHDPEFDAKDFTTFIVSEVGDMELWNHKKHRIFSVSFNFSEADEEPEGSWVDNNGRRYSDDFIIGAAIARLQYFSSWPLMNPDGTDVDENGNDVELMPRAIERVGRLQPNEIYGFFPAFQLGGDNVIDNVRRVDAVSHMLFLMQLEPMKLMKVRLMTDPNPNKIEFIRNLGKQ